MAINHNLVGRVVEDHLISSCGFKDFIRYLKTNASPWKITGLTLIVHSQHRGDCRTHTVKINPIVDRKV